MNALVIVCIVLGLVALGSSWFGLWALERAAYYKWLWEGERIISDVHERQTLRAELAQVEEDIDRYKEAKAS